MTIKQKVILGIALICITAVTLTVGVWALKSDQFNFGGTINFTATGINATISKGTFNNGLWVTESDATTKMPEVVITNSSTEDTLKPLFDKWSGLNLLFNEDGEDATITFSITNNSSKETNKIQASVIASAGTSNNATVTANPTSVIISPGEANKQNFTVTFHIEDTDLNASLAGFKIDIDLTHSEMKGISVSANNANYGIANTNKTAYKDGDQITFTATANSGYSFIGWAEENAEGKIISQNALYTFTADASTKSHYVAIFNQTTSTYTTNNLTYTLYNENKTAMLTNGKSYTGSTLTVPNTITSGGITYKVKGIGKQAFYNELFMEGNRNITSLTISEGINIIEDYAFAYCNKITSLSLNDGLTIIGDRAFMNCKIAGTLELPDSIVFINEKAFGNNNITSANLPLCLKDIRSDVFDGCPLTSIEIPDGIKIVGGLKNTNIEAVTIPNSVTSIVSGAFSGCSSLISVSIPDSVTSIGGSAFFNCSGLTSVTIGNGVTSIGDSAFYGCSSLTNVSIPDSVTEIGGNAFHNCTLLSSITMQSEIPPILYDTEAFKNCGALTKIFVPNVTALRLYKATKNWDNYAMLFVSIDGEEDDSYKLVDITNGHDYLTFSEPNASDNTISVTDCLTTTVIAQIPNQVIKNGITYNVTSIGEHAFSLCDIKYITIPDSVTSIGDSAFWNCEDIIRLTIPDGVTSIGGSVFFGCSGLTNVSIPDSVTSIGDWAFYNCSGLTSVTIGNGVTSIGDSVFKGCSSLTSITIPNKVTSIGYSAFEGCSGLTSVSIPDSVASIGQSAFKSCTGLTSITIGNGVTSIRAYAFQDCTSLTNVTIPETIEAIGYQAFYGCKNLLTVIMKGATPPTLGGSDLYGSGVFDSTALTTIYVPTTAAQTAYKAATYWKEYSSKIVVGP